MRIHIPVPLRWGDLDAYNHVNNVEIMRVLEEARVRAFWEPIDPREEREPSAVFEPAGTTLSVIAGHRIDYLRPIDYRRAPLDVQLWFSALGGASAELCYEVRDGANDTVYAQATSTLVFVDSSDMRPRRLGDREREVWQRYLGEPLTLGRRR